MEIKLKISNSLLSIYNNLEEEKTIIIEEVKTIGEILYIIGVNPLLTPIILIENKKVTINHEVSKNTEITLIGPLMGG